MKVAHMALWTRDLEQQAQFWVTFFDAKINEKYCSKTNPGFESYFVKIGEDIAIELMTKPGQGILVSGPRTTGDGYYEAVIRDPDGNLIEIVA